MVRRGFCISLALTGLVVSSAGAAPAQPLRPAPARATSIAPRSVRSESLSSAEQTRLVAGDTVDRPMVLTTGHGRYVGGHATHCLF